MVRKQIRKIAFSDYFIENYQNRVEIMVPEIKILDNDM